MVKRTADEYLETAGYAEQELNKLREIRYKTDKEKKRKRMLEDIYLESLTQYEILTELLTRII